jgi:4-hydroxythreonine-4-phosphate dehydrogenase
MSTAPVAMTFDARHPSAAVAFEPNSHEVIPLTVENLGPPPVLTYDPARLGFTGFARMERMTASCRVLYTMPEAPPIRIAITLGDVNGVGPEILARALSRPEIRSLAEYLVFGDAEVLRAAFELIGTDCDVSNGVCVQDARHAAPAVQPGELSAVAGKCAYEWITAAVEAIQAGEADALVTCPINKEAMLLSGHPELGHTELLSRLTESPDWRMCLYAQGKLVVHLSGHLPLVKALNAITRENVHDAIYLAHQTLLRTGLNSPRIAVAGINPHAGEHGAIGTEDDQLLVPVVAECAAAGIHCVGPVSPDTVFRQLWDGAHDAVIAMYHDQGHIAMKMVAMDEGASLTLGLPIIRTSPDHGTAFDIAWRGVARDDSLCAAITLAAQLARPTTGRT